MALTAVFQRAIALAAASASCLVACGAKTPLDGAAAGGEREADPPPVPEPCTRPGPPPKARSECSGTRASGNYAFSCDAAWIVDRPADIVAGAELSGPECVSICGNDRDWGACDEFCAIVPATCTVGCDWIRCTIAASSGGTSVGNYGRRPPGFAPSVPAGGEFWLAAAELEAASVIAFTVLRRELTAHDAPSSFVQWAERAAEEEERHARAMLALARRFGVAGALPPAPTSAEVRPLLAIALDNAVEGCVNETYAALLATWQAGHATDEAVRAAMTLIAADETSHARFSWSLDAWLATRLSPAERAEVTAARAGAITRLQGSLMSGPEEAALPAPREAAVLLSSLARDLLAA